MNLCLFLGIHSDFLIFPYMYLFLNVLDFNIWLPKGGKQERGRDKKGSRCLNFMKVISPEREKLTTMCYNNGYWPFSV